MQSLLSMFLVALMVIVGGIPSLYILISLPVILVQKFYRKVKYGTSVWN